MNNLIIDYVSSDPHTIYSDEWIEVWGKRYVRDNIARHGIEFEVFLECPLEILALIKNRKFLPLLAEQKKVQAALDKSLISATPGLAHEH